MAWFMARTWGEGRGVAHDGGVAAITADADRHTINPPTPTHRLLDRRDNVGAVAEDDVDVGEAHAREARLQPLDDVLARAPLRVQARFARAEEELGCNDEVGTPPHAILDSFSDSFTHCRARVRSERQGVQTRTQRDVSNTH